jgi:RNA-binding protein
MKPLTSSQRKRLRGLAHGFQPLVHLGKAGLTDAALAQIDKEIAQHELIKVRFLDSGAVAGKAEKDALIDEIQNRIGCGVAGRVGHVAILYRPHADRDKRRIDPGK